MKSTDQLIHGDMAEVYKAQSYSALVESWSGQTKGHMETLIEVSRLFADALDVAAEGVVAMPKFRAPQSRQPRPLAEGGLCFLPCDCGAFFAEF